MTVVAKKPSREEIEDAKHRHGRMFRSDPIDEDPLRIPKGTYKTRQERETEILKNLLPDEYVEALKKLYPSLSLRRAIRKHIILTVRLNDLQTRTIDALDDIFGES